MQRLTACITGTRAMLAIIMRLTSRAPVHAFVRRLGIFGSSLFFSFPSLFPEFWLLPGTDGAVTAKIPGDFFADSLTPPAGVKGTKMQSLLSRPGSKHETLYNNLRRLFAKRKGQKPDDRSEGLRPPLRAVEGHALSSWPDGFFDGFTAEATRPSSKIRIISPLGGLWSLTKV